MKAIILALEDGDALWPVPTGGSGLGAPLPGQTLLAWTARTLGGAGVSELILAVGEDACLPPQDILPLSLRRFPAGIGQTQALLACAQGLEEDFFLLSGARIWRGSLRDALEIHRAGGYALTRIELRSGPESPPPGGTGGAGRGRVVPFPTRDAQGPGLAVCAPALLPFLAGTEGWPALFARLRRAGGLGQAELPGRSCPIGSPAALLDAAAQLLSDRCLPGAEGPLRPGIWSASPLPEEVELVPPCLIGTGVHIGRGSLIGPHAVLEDGVCVGDHALVQRSIMQAGARAGSRATVYGALVCRRAVLGSCTVLNEGAAVGPDARVADNAVLMEGVGVGAGRSVPPSARLTKSLRDTAAPPGWTVERLLSLGRRLGRCGLVGAGGAGFRGQLLARTFGCGAAAQGAEVIFHDGLRPCHAAWLAAHYCWPASLFADEEGEIYLFGSDGKTLTAPPPDGTCCGGSWDLLAGTASAWDAACLREEIPAQAAFQPCAALDLL